MRFTIQDAKTGKSVTVEGDKVPALADREAIFQQAGLRGAQPSQPQGDNLLTTVGKFMAPNVTKALTQLPGELQQKAAAREQANPSKGNIINSIGNAAGNTMDLARGTILNPKLLAEEASYAMPFGKAGLLARLGVGGGAGFLQGVSRDNADPTSVGLSTAVGAGANAILPGLGNLLSKGLGKLALGTGGESLPAISEAVGKNLTGGGKYFGSSKFFEDSTKTLQDKLNELLGNKVGWTRSELMKKLDEVTSPEKVGAANYKQAQNYKNQILSVYEDLMKKHLGGDQPISNTYPKGVTPPKFESAPSASITMPDSNAAYIGNGEKAFIKKGGEQIPNPKFKLIKNPNYKSMGGNSDFLGGGTAPKANTNMTNGYAQPEVSSPLAVLLKLKQAASQDVGNWGTAVDKTKSGVAKEITGLLKGHLEEKGGSQGEVAKLSKLITDSMKIKNYQNEGVMGRITNSGKSGDLLSLVSSLKSAGIPIEMLMSLLGGHPAGAVAGAGAYALSKPQIATPIMAGLNSSGLSNVLMRLLNPTVAGTMTPSQ